MAEPCAGVIAKSGTDDQQDDDYRRSKNSFHLRNRVSYSAVYATGTPGVSSAGSHTSATFYTYHIHGNVDTLLQDYNDGVMKDAGNRFKKIVYDYDLISGKVNDVAYQPGQADAFYHHYEYDAENRLTTVYITQGIKGEQKLKNTWK